MFGRKKAEELKLAQCPEPDLQLTLGEVVTVKKCHEERLERERLVTANCKAHYIVFGGDLWDNFGFGWSRHKKAGIPDSLKLTKTQKEALKTHIASWLNESEWFKP